jgi:hypothetical protein
MRRMAPAKSVRPRGKRASQAILVRLEAEQRLQPPLGQDQAGSDIGGSPVCVGSDHRQYANAATSPPTISIPRARPAPTSNSRSTMASTPFTTRKIPPAINPLTTLTVPLSIEPILLLQSADSQPSNPEVCDVSRRTHRNWWSARVATSSQRCRMLPKFVCAPPRFKASRARINGTVGAFCVKRIASAWRRARLWMLHRGIARTGVCKVEGCDRPHDQHDLCGMHFQRWKATGDPGEAESKAISREGDCQNCGDSPIQAKGMCNACYEKARLVNAPRAQRPSRENRAPSPPRRRACAVVTTPDFAMAGT